MNSEATEPTRGSRPAANATLDAAQVGLGGGEILLAREQQGDVDRHAGGDRFLDRRNPFRRPGNLHEQVRPTGLLVDALGGRETAIGVTGQQRRDFHRDPAIEVIADVKHRAEQIRGTAKILQRQVSICRHRAAKVSDIPVIGVAREGWTLDRLRERARDSLAQNGGVDEAAFATLSAHLQYVNGDYQAFVTAADRSEDHQAMGEDADEDAQDRLVRAVPHEVPEHPR